MLLVKLTTQLNATTHWYAPGDPGDRILYIDVASIESVAASNGPRSVGAPATPGAVIVTKSGVTHYVEEPIDFIAFCLVNDDMHLWGTRSIATYDPEEPYEL